MSAADSASPVEDSPRRARTVKDARSLSEEEIEDYQRVLQRAGRYLGGIDGIWGPKTQRAHEAYVASLRAESTDDSRNTPADLVTVGQRIIGTAQHFLNLTETAPNARWDDVLTAGPDERAAELRQALIDTGWQLGWPYCAAFAEACWRAGYRDRPELALISRSITPSAMGTFENFDRLHRITKTPQIGALMLMQHGDTWQGHAGIVVALGDGAADFTTIEGNTSSNVASREGDGVYLKHKRFDLNWQPRGLWIRGFVNPFLV